MMIVDPRYLMISSTRLIIEWFPNSTWRNTNSKSNSKKRFYASRPKAGEELGITMCIVLASMKVLETTSWKGNHRIDSKERARRKPSLICQNRSPNTMISYNKAVWISFKAIILLSQLSIEDYTSSSAQTIQPSIQVKEICASRKLPSHRARLGQLQFWRIGQLILRIRVICFTTRSKLRKWMQIRET